MTNTKGNADGFFEANTTDGNLPRFVAKEKFYSTGFGRTLQGWASLTEWPSEHRNIALRFVNEGDIHNQIFDLANGDSGASARWWKSTPGSAEPPFDTISGQVTVTVNADTDAAKAIFKFRAVSPNGNEEVEVDGELDLVPNDQGRDQP